MSQPSHTDKGRSDDLTPKEIENIRVWADERGGPDVAMFNVLCDMALRAATSSSADAECLSRKVCDARFQQMHEMLEELDKLRSASTAVKSIFPLLWHINDHLKVTPDQGVEYTGSTNDVDRLRDALHKLDPNMDLGTAHEGQEAADVQRVQPAPANRLIPMDRHPLLLQAYELSVQVDRLPAHVEQTALITALGKWRDQLTDHLDRHGLLSSASVGVSAPAGEQK